MKKQTSKVTLAWAVVMKRGGAVCTNLKEHYAIYACREDAEADCPRDSIGGKSYARIARVRITEVRRKK